MEVSIKQDLSTEPVATEEVKQYVKFAYDSDVNEVSLLDNLISASRTHLEKMTGLVFAQKSFEIRFIKTDAEDAHFDTVTMSAQAEKYVLPVRPVYEVTEVKTVDIDESETVLTKNSDYYTKGKYNKEILYNLGLTQELVVTCTAGYGSNTETLPADLKEAIKKQAGRWYWYRDDYVEGKFLPEVKNIANRYSRPL